jgi:hypothetical protein
VEGHRFRAVHKKVKEVRNRRGSSLGREGTVI